MVVKAYSYVSHFETPYNGWQISSQTLSFSAKQSSLERQENLAPGQTVERRWQDPFITTMFAEPGAPVYEYDPSSQLRRGMHRRVSQPVGRGRVARNQRGVVR